MLIQTERVEANAGELVAYQGARGETPAALLRHPRVDFYSYPYEWTFNQLKDAALGHLELQLEALDLGATLSDATPYNMQLVEGRWQHVDVLSLRPYREGEPWVGYNQFCRLFLLPLLLESQRGIPFQSMLRGKVDGPQIEELTGLLPIGARWFSINGLLHLTFHSWQLRRNRPNAFERGAQHRQVPKAHLRSLLREMHRWIEGLSSRRQRSTWGRYAETNHYRGEDRARKLELVASMTRRTGAKRIWDLGGNAGAHSTAALEAGARTAVNLDGDLDALEACYAACRESQPGLVPVFMDLADPSPSMGWAQRERRGLAERANADAALAMALVHHLTITRQVPVEATLRWLVALAPVGMVELIAPDDPMVIALTRQIDQPPPCLTIPQWLEQLSRLAVIDHTETLPVSGRVIVTYQRK